MNEMKLINEEWMKLMSEEVINYWMKSEWTNECGGFWICWFCRPASE